MRNSKKIAIEIFSDVFNVHPSYANKNYTNFDNIIKAMFKYKTKMDSLEEYNKPNVDELMTLFYNSLDWYHGEITGVKGKWLEMQLKELLNK